MRDAFIPERCECKTAEGKRCKRRGVTFRQAEGMAKLVCNQHNKKRLSNGDDDQRR